MGGGGQGIGDAAGEVAAAIAVTINGNREIRGRNKLGMAEGTGP